MKTISEIAAEIGVSRQAVYQKIKREPLSSAVNRYKVYKVDRLYIMPEGEKLIKTAFINNEPIKGVNVLIDGVSTDTLTMLYTQNKYLTEQLAIEVRHNRELSERMADLACQLAELTRNSQILHKAEQSLKIDEKKKFSFFGFLKKKAGNES